MFAKKLIFLTIACSFLSKGYAQPHYQAHAGIYRTVNDYIADNMEPTSEYEINIAPLDPRLKLQECANPLQAFTPGNKPSLQGGRLSIGVRCNKTWSVFTSVTLKIYENVLVLSQPVRRGQILTRRHLAIEKRDTAKLRSGYIKRTDLIENKQAIRHMAAGTVLNEGLVTEPALIKRGEKIIIRAATASYDIRMQGLALMDGIKNQSIKVKNVSSGRTIAAKVIKPGLVSVMY